MTQQTSDDFKLLGSAAFKQGNFQEAITQYSNAIDVEPTHVLYSNRSACYASIGNYSAALDDAKKCTEMNPTWPKGYNRLATAYEGLDQIKEAMEAYQKVTELDPTNESSKQAIQGLFQRMLAKMQQNMPQQSDTPMPDLEKEEPKMEEVVEKSEEELLKEKVTEIKNKGNALYKKKEFDEAIKLYNEAFAMSNEKEISCLTNKAAVLFEKENFEEAIQVCLKAVEIGREIFADFKLISRAFARIGNCYFKMNDLENAKDYYNKSLTECRTADVLDKLRECEKLIRAKAKQEYHNPQLSQEARDRGNELFKDQKFAEAVKEYTEAINRDENDPRAYSNRSACYHKLVAFPEALKDCEKCIELDPTFTKAYLRKATLQNAMKDNIKALETLDACAISCALNDAQKYEMNEIRSRASYQMNSGEGLTEKEVQEKAARDPEVQRVMGDPAMRVILEQMQKDPACIQEHMKNPQVMKNLRVLMNAGILKMQ
eukprot:NODE_922_length_3086_cov_0.393036.p1 type:complete len:487 gc:universal NODE_922_length_3086_cov_0.393036:2916-1456(-)